MKITIKPKPKAFKVYKNIFKITIKTMVGDADAYETIDYYLKKSEEVLKDYSFISDHELDGKAIATYFKGDWPRDPYNGIPNTVDDIQITWFDQNGIEHDTAITND